MAKKAKVGSRKVNANNAPVEKDDGTRWTVVDESNKPIYLLNGGVTKGEAERLSEGLVARTMVAKVSEPA